MEITVSANAKLNLFLDITGRRSDGYHTISSVMHTLDLHDSLTLSHAKTSGITLTSTHPYLPLDESNIIIKAAKQFLMRLHAKDGLSLHLVKRIPIGGGLGGSSTDGAATLTGLNFLFGRPFSDDELLNMAASLSADMPFCLKKGAALCQGIGDELTDLPALSSCFAVVIKPRFSLSTKLMYALYDEQSTLFSHPDIGPMLDAIHSGDVSAVGKALYNVFLPLAEAQKPSLRQFIDRLILSGASYVSMSGSGSCLFALFDRLSCAEAVWERLQYDDQTAFLTRLL